MERRLVEVEEATIDPVRYNLAELKEEFGEHVRKYVREIEESNTEHREKIEEVNNKVDNLIKEANKQIEVTDPLLDSGAVAGSGEAVAELLKKI
jgi:sugar-specific transcriptional regulator TrmB